MKKTKNTPVPDVEQPNDIEKVLGVSELLSGIFSDIIRQNDLAPLSQDSLVAVSIFIYDTFGKDCTKEEFLDKLGTIIKEAMVIKELES